MIAIKEIAFTGYPVTDMVRARAFYEGVIGLKPSMTFEHKGHEWIEYEIGSGTLALSNMNADQWKPSDNGPAVALEIVDFNAAVAVLRAAKVPFAAGPVDTGVCHMAVVSDPDGNKVCFHKMHPH